MRNSGSVVGVGGRKERLQVVERLPVGGYVHSLDGGDTFPAAYIGQIVLNCTL